MAISLLVKLLFIILLSPTITKTNVAHAWRRHCVEHDKTLLLELRNQLVFDSSRSTYLMQWNQIDDCCGWEGVGCDDAGHVIRLDLNGESISGGFNDSSSLFRLKYLEVLDLSNNFLEGSHITREIHKLTHITSLVLRNSSLKGSLPHSITNLHRLSQLDLSYCKLSGTIPLTLLSNLTQLVYVNLSDNFFTGSISSIRFEALSNLLIMDLSYNSLTGTIPASIFTLSSLSELDLHHNQFSGLASEFPIVNISSTLSSLQVSLSHNSFNNTFQLEKIISLPNLKYLDISYNNLSLLARTIVPSSSNISPVKQSSLNILDLSNNKIAGEIPSWIWEIGNGSLLYLNLSCNMLVNLQKPYNVPASLSLDVLDLHSNQLRGEFPSSLLKRAFNVDLSNNYFDKLKIGNFSVPYLSYLSLKNNSMSGSFPSFICNATFLQILDLSVNYLRGSIPHCVFENIQVLNLGRNNISGRIPNNFSPNCKLKTLDLSDNHLIGEVPLSLGNCRLLEVMNVGNNQIDDNFPCMLRSSSLQVLVLRSNRFHGEIKCGQKSWPNLQIIDIAYNHFSGYLNPLNLSSWRGMMRDTVTKLTYKPLDFTDYYSNNNYYGNVSYYKEEVTLTIKEEEQKLVKIWPDFTSIDLSSNNFQGHIPEEIGGLDALDLLNLSHNPRVIQ